MFSRLLRILMFMFFFSFLTVFLPSSSLSLAFLHAEQFLVSELEEKSNEFEGNKKKYVS